MNEAAKEMAKEILDRLQEWAKQDTPAAEWLSNEVEKIVLAYLASTSEACANLGAELAMATNALPSRRVEGVMAAFRILEDVLPKQASRD